MALGPSTLANLANAGVNLEIKKKIGPSTLINLAKTVAENDQHLTISSKIIGPSTALKLAQIAKNKLTIVVEE